MWVKTNHFIFAVYATLHVISILCVLSSVVDRRGLILLAVLATIHVLALGIQRHH